MFTNRKLFCGVALFMCLVLLLSSQTVNATAAQTHGVAQTGANSLARATTADASAPLPPSPPLLATRTALAKSELAKRTVTAPSAGEGSVRPSETSAKWISEAALDAHVPLAAAVTHAAHRVAEAAEAASKAAADPGPIITGSVITGLVVVLCFAGVLTLLVLVEIVPHARRWMRACRGETEEKTQEEQAADRAVELAARERVDRALHHGGGKDKDDALGGLEPSVVATPPATP